MSPPLAWLGLALVLGLAELVAPGVFLVFVALAAAATGLMALALPDLPLVAQLGAFGVWAGVAVLVGRHWYGERDDGEGDALLNDRAARLIGEEVRVTDAIEHGRGRVRVGDSVWLARGPETEAGACVRVVAVDGAVLVVEAVEWDR